jgi:hypothetical protein
VPGVQQTRWRNSWGILEGRFARGRRKRPPVRFADNTDGQWLPARQLDNQALSAAESISLTLGA